jgi:3-oxoacyl-[acyl-carrier-protein] synthase II
MHRLFERGARLASPAEFPNLVPSSPAGHVTIYLGVKGPALTIADLGTSAESAFALAADLVRSGEADRVVAGGIEEASVIVESVFQVLFASSTAVPERVSDDERSTRGEGGGALVVESESSARARGARVLARLAHAVQWRDDAGGPSQLRLLPPPRDAARARVVLGRESAGADPQIDGLLKGTAWSAVPRLSCRARVGNHEAVGAVALVAAASLVARGEARCALVLGLARGRGHAFVLTEPDRA